MEFRADNNAALRGFRRSMLRYAGDLNGKVANVPPAEIQAATKFFVDTEIVPALDELRAKMNAPARPWYKRAVDFGRVLPKVVPSFFTMNPSTIIGSILTNYAGEFFTELSAVGEKRESLKKSGLRCSRSTIRPRPAICRSVWANISSGGNSGPLIRKPRNRGLSSSGTESRIERQAQKVDSFRAVPAAFARVFLREPTKLDQFGLGRL